jgi:putative FmdB family regulatory protein
MPIHEFVCKKCKVTTEALVFNKDEETEIRCKKCKGKVRKILSTFSYEMNGFNEGNGYAKKKE